MAASRGGYARRMRTNRGRQRFFAAGWGISAGVMIVASRLWLLHLREVVITDQEIRREDRRLHGKVSRGREIARMEFNHRGQCVVHDIDIEFTRATHRGSRRLVARLHSEAAADWMRGARRAVKAVVEFASDRDRRKMELWPSVGGDFEIMKRVKGLVDPRNLLNRGRLYRRI